MILLSLIVLKDKCIEFTDIVNIVNLQEEYLVEWIVEQIYLDKEKGDE